AAFEPTNRAVGPLRIELLKQTVAKTPDRTNRVIELAVAYEQMDQLDDSCNLLRPYQHRLGDTEGARILGKELLKEGNFADAYELLFPYVQSRLGQLHVAEKNYNSAAEAARRRAVDELNQHSGPPSFYAKYGSATREQKD